MNIQKETLSTEELILALENSKEFAFETVFKFYYTNVFHIARNYLGNKENAEEITQNVFFKLWKDFDHISEVNNVGGYLFKMTRNACLDFFKHEKVKHDFIQNTKKSVDLQYVQDDASALLLENELLGKIEEGINLLPEKCRKIFIHSRFDGLKNQEIAKMYSISKRTVDNHIAKGIKHMRLYLKDFATLLLFCSTIYIGILSL
ncbi:RNA polymerase sigma-70 factor [Flagellimonas flava]|uniref:RNA polymerase sigma-70 factor, ECF subfamily n=1 Tax=Flagellimonas flava TaxID=570519 RepID=A0A1M5JZ93_9FLAO|nr:RNA polymerase sigma-70 factor [Allomuricauda flava]SHG45353.1 RNA polymerase sigma-70 factor, ECF subfamily [Allomuricauda flava]